MLNDAGHGGGSFTSEIVAALDALSNEPRPEGAVKLAGRDDYRVRVGDYRIVYAIVDSDDLIIVARIAHRRDVYRP